MVSNLRKDFAGSTSLPCFPLPQRWHAKQRSTASRRYPTRSQPGKTGTRLLLVDERRVITQRPRGGQEQFAASQRIFVASRSAGDRPTISLAQNCNGACAVGSVSRRTI